jgi:hypothetical protein
MADHLNALMEDRAFVQTRRHILIADAGPFCLPVSLASPSIRSTGSGECESSMSNQFVEQEWLETFQSQESNETRPRDKGKVAIGHACKTEHIGDSRIGLRGNQNHADKDKDNPEGRIGAPQR